MNENKFLDDLEEKSEIYQMIMAEPPKLYLRSGFVIIALFLLIFTIICYFIDYSNYISSEVKIVSSTPRAPLICGVNGRITNLLENNVTVKRNDLIAIIENPAIIEDVNYLEKIIAKLELNDSITNFNTDLKLGELQNSFANFVKAKNELEIFNTIQGNKNKAIYLKRELNEGINLVKSLDEEKKNLKEKMLLSESQLSRSKKLYEKGVISLNEYEIAKQKHVDNLNEYQSKISQIQQTQINNQKTSSSINSTIIEGSEYNSRIESDYKTSLNGLKSDIELWKKKYLIISPIDGVLNLNGIWANQQVVEVGEELGSILPENDDIFAIAKMPEFESGKVNKMNDVIIYLNSYNFSEYGTIKGVVKNVSSVPIEGFYNVEIELPLQLKTDLNYSIPYSPELSGEARLITEKLNLLERLFYKLKKLFTRKKSNLVDVEKEKNDKNIK
ncbi:HlyD family secretion protein [Flavobacterium sp.]|uniref:HlyD family efflux transporter periplasmic adaptor subunit n=1 Tax=Flavobacterium sp. TaxID=239 RepID=UPI0026329A84|nr:HlyD family secretion protein [Flavobacterium sp.]MDD2984752.1 HlyD family efflux transporter periplasmic adaptor subunit [Flavobacterium sp.]